MLLCDYTQLTSIIAACELYSCSPLKNIATSGAIGYYICSKYVKTCQVVEESCNSLR